MSTRSGRLSSRVRIIEFFLAACFWVSASQAAVIGFEDVGPHQSQFTAYQEDGFTVTPGSDLWMVNRIYGAPAPFVQFLNHFPMLELVTGLFVSAGGPSFTFASVDLYSSVTPIPHRIRGYRDSNVIFDFFDTVPLTLGQFRTVLNPTPWFEIDLLYIQLINPPIPCCGPNPMGMDNIVVSLAARVPEPSTLALLALGLGVCAFVGRSTTRSKG